MLTINCKGKLITTEIPLVMGIINATPDSFYRGDLKSGMEGILSLADKMIAEGATILDIGGQSTKPNANAISVQEEIDRVIPVVKAVFTKYPNTIISIDTFNSQVAVEAVNAGASMVNDVSGGELDTEMINAVGKLKNIPYICMHSRGNATSMQNLTQYENMVEEVLQYLATKKDACTKAGIVDFIVDPGFGFAKTIAQNFSIIKNLQAFKALHCPVLIGVSRKSSIYKTLGSTALEALNGTTVLNTLALNNGANILRVHDVKEAMEVVKLMEVYSKSY